VKKSYQIRNLLKDEVGDFRRLLILSVNITVGERGIDLGLLFKQVWRDPGC
jgi:hypothetical protein